MALTPQITLTANLESIVGAAAVGGYLRVTLCGYGPQPPAVPGTCMLANAGVPQLVGPQIDSTPISVELFGNDVITPANTFYEVSVLDQNQDVIQSAIYQFNGSGTTDLADAQPILPPYGYDLGDLQYLECTGSGSNFVAPGRVIAPAYNGILLPLGLALPTLSYTLATDQVTITLNFSTEMGDRIDALCVT